MIQIYALRNYTHTVSSRRVNVCSLVFGLVTAVYMILELLEFSPSLYSLLDAPSRHPSGDGQS